MAQKKQHKPKQNRKGRIQTGAWMDEMLFRGLKTLAAQRGKPLGEIFDEAARRYLSSEFAKGQQK